MGIVEGVGEGWVRWVASFDALRGRGDGCSGVLGRMPRLKENGVWR